MVPYGINTVVLVAGAAAQVSWQDPWTGADLNLTDSQGRAIDPQELAIMRTVVGGVVGDLTVTADGEGFSVASSSATDTSTIRVIGRFRPQYNPEGHYIY
jgi:hypothetical protein